MLNTLLYITLLLLFFINLLLGYFYSNKFSRFSSLLLFYGYNIISTFFTLFKLSEDNFIYLNTFINILIIQNFVITIILILFLRKNFSINIIFYKRLNFLPIIISYGIIFLSIITYLNSKLYTPILALFNDGIVDAYVQRTLITNNAEGTFLQSVLFIYVIPIIFVYSYYNGFKKNYNRNYLFLNRLLFLSSFLIILLYSISLVQKYYLIQSILILLLSIILVNNEKFSLKFFLKYSLLISILGVGSFYIYNTEAGILALFESFLGRLFFTNYDGAYAYLDFAHNNRMLLGSSFPNPLGIFPYDVYPLTTVISKKYIASNLQLEAGIVGSHPSIYFYEMFVNFGYFGVFFSTFIIFIFLAFMDRILMNDLRVKILITFLFIQIIELINGSFFLFFSVFFFNEGILLALTIIWIWAPIKKFKIYKL